MIAVVVNDRVPVCLEPSTAFVGVLLSSLAVLILMMLVQVVIIYVIFVVLD